LSIGAEEVTFLSVHIVRIVSSHTEDS
jgi:hypothetical protein